MDQATRISGRDLRTELIKKSTGVVRNVIMMAHPDASDDDLINMIREDFSDAPTMNEAREELLHMCQKPEEQMFVYVYRYGRMHQRSSGIRAAEETHQHVIQDFIKSLKPKIKNKFANKFAEGRFQTMHFHLHWIWRRKFKLPILSGTTSWIAGPPQQLMRSSPFPWMNPIALTKFLVLVTGTTIQTTMARITTAASHGNRETMAKLGKTRTIKQWQNRDNKPWQNKDKKSWQSNKNKEDKPCDTCFTLSQDKKFFVPADCDKNVFQIICTLVKAQIDKAKQSGGSGKEINEISKDTLVNLLNISGKTYDAVQSAVREAEKDEISSSSSSSTN